MAHRVVLIPGDGTGPELTEATRRVLEATGVEFDWDVREAGAEAMDAARRQPAAERDARRRSAQAGRAQGADHDAGRRRLPLGQRRRCARSSTCTRRCGPARRYPGVRTRFDDVDLIIIRENTEDLYAGIEYEQGTPRRRGADRLDRVERRQAALATTPASRSSRSRSPARAASSSSPSTTRAGTAAARSRPSTRRTS